MIANGLLAAQNGLEMGQTVMVQTANGPQASEVVDIGVDYLNAKGAAGFVSHATMERDFLETGDVLFLIEMEEGVDEAGVQDSSLATSWDLTARSTTQCSSFQQPRQISSRLRFAPACGILLVLDRRRLTDAEAELMTAMATTPTDSRSIRCAVPFWRSGFRFLDG